MLNNEQKAAILAVAELAPGWWPDKSNPGMVESEVFADYNDKLSSPTLKEILQTPNPMDTFYEKITEWYGEEADSLEHGLVQHIIEKLDEDRDDDFWAEHEDDVWEWVYEHTTVKLPCDHFLKQTVLVNILVDTGDGNYDFTLNTLRYMDNTVDNKASMVWLAKQQGYTKSQLWKALSDGETNGDKFLKSIRREAVNQGSHLNTLAFLVQMTLEEVLELNRLVSYADSISGESCDYSNRPYAGYIVIDKNTRCGFIDDFWGSGSLLEIDLQKDVRLPARFIHSAMPDGTTGCYSVREVYGTNEELWESGGVKRIHFPAKALAS